MLCDGQSSQSPIERSPCLGHKRLAEQERKIHLPDYRHLVKEDNSSFEESIDLFELRLVPDGVFSS